MKKRVKTQPSNPFYSNEPAVSRKLIADQGMTQNASLGNQTPKMVPKHPGRLSGIAGFESKSKPHTKPTGITTTKISAPAKAPAQGHLRASGHPKAHQLGGIKPVKLKV